MTEQTESIAQGHDYVANDDGNRVTVWQIDSFRKRIVVKPKGRTKLGTIPTKTFERRYTHAADCQSCPND